MQTVIQKNARLAASDLVVSLFTDIQSASGAIADLGDAGFDKSQILVALSTEGRRGQKHLSIVQDLADQEHLEQTKSLAWRLRRSFEHDLHRRGTDQMAGQDKNQSSGEAILPFTEVNLGDVLLPLGVCEDTVQLMDREIGPDGVLILVHAPFHCKEAQSILERNTGIIRTDTATESHPLAS
jgi:hypothetical protein